MRRRAFWLLLAALATTGCMTAAPLAERPGAWATPVAEAQLPNLHRVDAGLWRSAVPGARLEPATLQRLGIRTVVNLRREGDPTAWTRDAGIATQHIPVATWNVRDAQIVAALRTMTDPARRPVLVHCTHGADRTGLMVAAYRVVVQGWSKDEAEREMVRGGYGYHLVWRNLRRELRGLDVAGLRAQLGLPAH